MRRVDAFAHILPPRYLERLEKNLENAISADQLRYYRKGVFRFDSSISDLDARWRSIDRFGDYRQVLVLAVPPLEEIGPPHVATDFARLANEEMASLVARHPDRFAGFAASLPLNDVDAALLEMDRAVRDMGALGVQVFTSVQNMHLDDPRFEPLFARLEELDRVVWLHPTRRFEANYGLWWSLGWPYETAAALSRLVYSGVMERHPGLKVIAHHGAGMVPHFSARLGMGPGYRQVKDALPRPPLDYFRMFFADTALFGAPHAVRCVLDFFGPSHVLFGTDTPLGRRTRSRPRSKTSTRPASTPRTATPSSAATRAVCWVFPERPMLPSMAEQPPPSNPPVNPPPPPGPEASRAEWRAWRHTYGRPYWMGEWWFGWGFFWPAVLIVLGLYWLLSNLGLLWWLRGDVVWPVLLILFGLALIFGRGRWWR